MKRIILSIICASLAFFAAAQQRTPVSLAEQAAMEKEIAIAAGKIESVIYDFEQVRTSSLLSEDAVSHGKMYYRVDAEKRSLRWEYDDGYTFIENDGRIQVLSATGKPVGNSRASRFFREIINTMLVTVSGSSMVDKTNFSAAYYADNDHWYIILTPTKDRFKNMFASIELVFDARDHNAQRVVITEGNGDRTVISFMNTKFNTMIDDEKFLIR